MKLGVNYCQMHMLFIIYIAIVDDGSLNSGVLCIAMMGGSPLLQPVLNYVAKGLRRRNRHVSKIMLILGF
ncbi:unnamed protein product [Lathyrus oleraceus]